LEYRIN
jgi:hypothetical protein